MERRSGESRIHPDWWTAILITVAVVVVVLVGALFNGSLSASVPVTLISDRAGLVMEPGAKVKMRGVVVGHVAEISGGNDPVSLALELDPDQIQYIPANIEARIASSTVFGAKYVDLTYPADPSPAHLSAGEVLRSQNTTAEVNTVFQNLVAVINKVDPAKLNAVLSALAEGVRGQGERIGEATTSANQVLLELNLRNDTITQNWRSFHAFNVTYSAAAQDIVKILDAASTTSSTITTQAQALDALLLNTIGFARSGIDLIGPNKDNLIHAVNVLEPTTNLLMQYNPELTCVFVGGNNAMRFGQADYTGGADGKSLIVDAALLLGDDPYRYPDNLPIVAARGGPGGAPGCGSLPDVADNWPVRQLVANTGFGTGLDYRPNPGIGFPGWANFFPVTRAVPEDPSIRYPGGPAPGPIPYPGAPPYGAPLYGADGAPLYPGVPAAVTDPPPSPSTEPQSVDEAGPQP